MTMFRFPQTRYPILPCRTCAKPTDHKFSRGRRAFPQQQPVKADEDEQAYMHLMFGCSACGAERVYGTAIITAETRSALHEVS